MCEVNIWTTRKLNDAEIAEVEKICLDISGIGYELINDFDDEYGEKDCRFANYFIGNKASNYAEGDKDTDDGFSAKDAETIENALAQKEYVWRVNNI
ncbi:MAG TPA: hypothetical protein PKY82_32920 [Pyrinomonadaceae bacterium]|nr:hypothetical protein [Pyrinomonadaceae bacterium]